jgi:hypothetical protein
MVKFGETAFANVAGLQLVGLSLKVCGGTVSLQPLALSILCLAVRVAQQGHDMPAFGDDAIQHQLSRCDQTRVSQGLISWLHKLDKEEKKMRHYGRTEKTWKVHDQDAAAAQGRLMQQALST